MEYLEKCKTVTEHISPLSSCCSRNVLSCNFHGLKEDAQNVVFGEQEYRRKRGVA